MKTAALPDGLAARLRDDERLAGWPEPHYMPDVGSTNDVALELASRGAEEGTAVLADHQRAGRGRRGRTWFSPPGSGVYLSTVVRPDVESVPLITLAAGVAAATALSASTALPVELKWPNDLVIGRPWRKVGGLLCETSGTSGRIDAVVVGIGVNVQRVAYPSELVLRATSLEAELGREVDRDRLIVDLLVMIRQTTNRLRTSGSSWVLDEWRRLGRSGLGASPVTWREGDTVRRGLARDLDDAGALVVDADGTTVRLIAGEVIWERMS